jgi:hypothetical protein
MKDWEWDKYSCHLADNIESISRLQTNSSVEADTLLLLLVGGTTGAVETGIGGGGVAAVFFGFRRTPFFL